MLYAILCYHAEDVVGSWSKEEDDAVMAKLAVVQDKLTKQGRLGPVARLLPTTAATTLRKDQRPAAGDRRAVRRDQGAAARLLRRRLRRPRRGARTSRASSASANPGGAYEIRPVGAISGPEECRGDDRPRLDRRGADLGPPPGGRRAAALFPRSRHRRGGLSGGLPAGAEDLAAERPAARSGRLADLGRPQRRASTSVRRRAQAGSRCPTRTAISDLGDAEGALAERLDGAHYRDDILRLLFICCHPDLPATQQIALALRIVSGLTVKQIARAFLVGEAAMEQRITRAKARVAEAGVPFETPGAVERAERLAAVAAMIYLLFNEGYSASGDEAERARAAVRRGDPAGAAAAAAVPDRAGDHGADRAAAAAACAHAPARFDADGAIVLLEDQDRTLWNRRDDRRGPGADRQGDAPPPARPLPGPGRDRRAACARRDAARTPTGRRSTCSTPRSSGCSPRRWSRSTAPSRSRKVRGPEAALAMIEPLARRLAGYFYFHGVKGALLMQLGRNDEARVAFDRAIALANTPAEAAHIRMHLDRLIRDSQPKGAGWRRQAGRRQSDGQKFRPAVCRFSPFPFVLIPYQGATHAESHCHHRRRPRRRHRDRSSSSH